MVGYFKPGYYNCVYRNRRVRQDVLSKSSYNWHCQRQIGARKVVGWKDGHGHRSDDGGGSKTQGSASLPLALALGRFRVHGYGLVLEDICPMDGQAKGERERGGTRLTN